MSERREFVGGVLSRTTEYTYDLDGTLAAATFTGGGSGINDGSRIDYAYDHTGELVGRELTSAAGFVVSDDRYLVDRQNLTGYSQRLAVIDGVTGAVKSFITFTDQLAAQASVTSSAVTTSHLQTDGLGSIRNLTSTDAGGQSTSEAYDYTAFGSLTAGDRSLTARPLLFRLSFMPHIDSLRIISAHSVAFRFTKLPVFSFSHKAQHLVSPCKITPNMLILTP